MPVQTDSSGFLTSSPILIFRKKCAGAVAKAKPYGILNIPVCFESKEDGYGDFTVMAAPNVGGLPLCGCLISLVFSVKICYDYHAKAVIGKTA